MQTKLDFIGGNTKRCLMAMALPMIAAMFLNMMYNLVDSLWIGNLLGEIAYAALTNSTPIILILTSVAMGATNGISILLSQAIGAKDKEKTESDTMHITRAFLDGMKEAAAQEIHTIDVTDKHIEFCRGCFVCKYNGGHCTIDDDMHEILEQILSNDLLLFSYPLYCYGMPAMLKNLIDRTLPLSSMAMAEVNGRYVHVGQRDYSHLKYLMICGCGFPNSKKNFEPAVHQFELLFPNNHTILTVPESPMFNAPEAAVVTAPRLELVKEAGQQYAQTGEIDAVLLAEIGSPMISEETYAKIVNGNA